MSPNKQALIYEFHIDRKTLNDCIKNHKLFLNTFLFTTSLIPKYTNNTTIGLKEAI